MYLSRNLAAMKANTIAGFVVTCVGDNRAYSFLPSRNGATLADRVAEHVLKNEVGEFARYSFLDRGSDERQYCSPGVELPVVSVMRTKYAQYPEYHTSLDDLSLVSPEGLSGAYRVLQRCLEVIEANAVLRTTVLCEPQLGKRGLYPTLSTNESGRQVQTMMNLLAYADGSRDLVELSDLIGAPAWECAELAEKLMTIGLVEAIDKPAPTARLTAAEIGTE